jgi:crossover junction endodeoxyribonuclease RuvC
VLGVDPGLIRTGWAAVASRQRSYELIDFGFIAPVPSRDLPERLADGFREFSNLLAEHAPDLMVLEDVFSAPRYPRSALLMAHMRGVLCLAAGQRGLQVEPMTATTVKQRLTGNGHASKQQVMGMVLRLCGVTGRKVRADVTDAMALAVAGLNEFDRPSSAIVGTPRGGL